MTGGQTLHLAELNVATLIAPIDDPRVAEFVDNLERINAVGDASPGFVWRLQTEDGDATAVRAYPDPLTIVNLTVWESVDALTAFMYKTDHVGFLRRRREWFVPGASGVALWWTPAGELPSIDDAVRRLACLRRLGPTPYAFTFSTVFEPAVVVDEPTEPLRAG